MLGKDNRAVEGLPIKLMVTAIVLAITIPLMFGSLKAYDESKARQELDREILEFTVAAQDIYTAGPGNSQSVDFDAKGGTFSPLEYVRFGDAPGGNLSSVIRFSLAGGVEAMRLVQYPNVPMMSLENNTLELMPGQYRIRIRCSIWEADLNGDGLMPDNYIQLSLSSV